MTPDERRVAEAAFGEAIDAERARPQKHRRQPQGGRSPILDDDRPSGAAFEAKVLDELDRERARREARRRLDAEARGDQPLPAIPTLTEFLGEPDTGADFRIDGWLPAETRAILAATFKSGKTTLIACLLRSLVDGDPFLDAAAVTPITGAVALIDTEMSRRQLKGWLGAQRIRHGDRVRPIALRGSVNVFDVLDPDRRTAWAAALRALDVQFVVLDCLRPVLDALGLDEHREAGRFLVAFDALLAEAGIREACVVHHMGHTGERSRGDSRLRDWPDVEWRLIRDDAENPASPRYLAAYGRDVDQPEQALAWDAEARRLTLAGGSRADTRTGEALSAVLDVLGASDVALSVRAIQTALADSEHPRATVRAAIAAGVRIGSIAVERGPRGAHLHRPACQRAAVCHDRAGHGVIECASRSIERRTLTAQSELDSNRSAGTLADLGLSPPSDPWAGVVADPPGHQEAAAAVAERLARGDRLPGRRRS